MARPTKASKIGPKLVAVPTGEAVETSDHAGQVELAPLRQDDLRVLEALLFAAASPLDVATLARHLPMGANVPGLVAQLRADYSARGINLVEIGGKWAFRTAPDLGHLLEQHATEERRLSRAAMETLAIISYHQPVTRAEIEDIRGVSTSAGTLDVLMETGWVKPRGRRRAPGRPLTYGTSDKFLEHFSLESLKDLPGLNDLKGAGLLDANLPPDFAMPQPRDLAALMPDEMPLDAGDEPPEPQGEMDLDAHAGDDEDATPGTTSDTPRG